MPLQPVLIAGEWREARPASDSFSAMNPNDQNALG